MVLPVWQACSFFHCLQVGGRFFWAHKVMLCSRSSFFHTLLTSTSFKEGRENARLAASEPPTPPQEVVLDFSEPNTLAVTLRWMYTDRVDDGLSVNALLEVEVFSMLCMERTRHCGIP